MARTNVHPSAKTAARARPRAEVRPAAKAPATAKTARLTYRDAGVDIDAKMKAIERIKGIARGTQREGVLGEIGSFGGLFDLLAAGSWRRPVLVGSTDGVGTKIKVAMRL